MERLERPLQLLDRWLDDRSDDDTDGMTDDLGHSMKVIPLDRLGTGAIPVETLNASDLRDDLVLALNGLEGAPALIHEQSLRFFD